MTRLDINFNEDGSGQPNRPVDVDSLAREIDLPKDKWERKEATETSRILREWAKEQEKERREKAKAEERERKEAAKARETERRERQQERGRIQREAERNVASAARERSEESSGFDVNSPQESPGRSELLSGLGGVRRPLESFLRERLHRSRGGRMAVHAYDFASSAFRRAGAIGAALRRSQAGTSIPSSPSGFELLHDEEANKPLDVDELAKSLRTRSPFAPAPSAMTMARGRYLLGPQNEVGDDLSRYFSPSAPKMLPGQLLSQTTGRLPVVAAGGSGGGSAGASAAVAGAGGAGRTFTMAMLGGGAGAGAIGGAALGGFSIAIGASAALAAAFVALERTVYSSSKTLRNELGGQMPQVAMARALADANKTFLALELDKRMGGRLASLESGEAMRDRFSLRRDAALFELLGPFTELRELASVSTAFVVTDALEKFAAASKEQGGAFGIMLENFTLGLADGNATAQKIKKLLERIVGKNESNIDGTIDDLLEGFRASTPIAFGPPSGGAL